MKYIKPEVEITDFTKNESIMTGDIISASSGTGGNESEDNGYVLGDNELPVRPRNFWN